MKAYLLIWLLTYNGEIETGTETIYSNNEQACHYVAAGIKRTFFQQGNIKFAGKFSYGCQGIMVPYDEV